jgi:hypothetical protein
VDKNFSRLKRAFDSVCETWRRLGNGALIQAINHDTGSKSSTSNNAAAPRRSEFMADFELALKPILKKKKITFNDFFRAYSFDSIDVIEREQHAQAVLGSMRHSLEQRAGDVFIKRGLYPVHLYFVSIRSQRPAGKGNWAAGASVQPKYKPVILRDEVYDAAMVVLNAPPETVSAVASSVSSSLGGEQSEREIGEWIEHSSVEPANTQPSNGYGDMGSVVNEPEVTHQDLMFAQTVV